MLFDRMLFSTSQAALSIGIVPLTLLTLIASEANAATITASASGSPNPPIVNENSLQNGDFLITPNVSPGLGDGVDEFVNWDFDFNSDPNLSQFLSSINSNPLVLH